MNRRTLLTVSVIALFVLPGLSLAAITGSPDLSAQFGDDRVVPGEETSLELVLLNEGDLDQGSARNPSLDSEVTTARGLTAEVASGDAPVTVLTGEQAVGTLPEGASSPIPFRIAVDEDAEPGTYSVPVRVSYSYTSYVSEGDGARERERVTETLRADVTVEDGARVEVVDVDSNARVGSAGTVALTVENAGTETATDARLTLTSESASVTFGGTNAATQYLGDWEPGEQRTVEYRAAASDDARAGRYPFTVAAAYERAGGRDAETAPVRLGAIVAREQRFRVVSADSAVSVGNSGAVDVRLRNAGPTDVSDATVQFTATGGHLGFGQASSTSRHVGNWSAGETKTVTVDATAGEGGEPGRYALDAAVAYDDPEGDRGRFQDLSVGVDVAAEQSFAVRNVSSTLRVGDDGRLAGELTNTGDRAVENVVLTWASEHRNVNPTETEYAVGTLEPGASAAFDFDVEVSDAARSGPRQFSLVAEYENGGGDHRETDPMKVRGEVASQRDVFDVEVVHANVSAGGSSTVELRVTNAGEEALSDVSAKLFADAPISANDDEAFEPRLEPGASATMTFSVGAGGAALEKTYPLSMDFQYDEPDGDTVTSDTYRVPVSVTRSEGGVPLAVVGAVALLAVVGIGAFLRLR